MNTRTIVIVGLAIAIAIGISVPLVSAYTGSQGYRSATPGNPLQSGFGGMMGGGYGRGMMGSGYGGMMNGCLVGTCSQYMAGLNYAGNNPVVVMSSDAFLPSNMTIKSGTTVTWINMDFVAHTVTSGSEQAPTNLFDSHELYHMQSFSYTFTLSGIYAYYCDIHPGMVGTITVT